MRIDFSPTRNFNPLMAAGAIASGISSIGKLIMGIKQNKLANKIHPQWQDYTASPYAQQRLGIGQQLFNGRMAGAAGLERNIFANQGNTLNSINRNSTNSAQALALAGASQGQTNQAFDNLAIQESQNKLNLLGNLNQGYEGMISEGDKVYQNKLMKYQIDKQDQAALRGSAWQNIFGAGNDIAGGLGTMGQGQQQMDFWSKLFGSGGGGNMSAGAKGLFN
jgi:hypothetical protein